MAQDGYGGHASSHQLRRLSVDSSGDTIGLANFVGDAPEQSFDKTPKIPIAGTSDTSAFYGKLRADSSFGATRLLRV